MMVIGSATGADGWNDENTIQAVAGGIVALAGLVWGLWEKYRLKQVGITKTPRKMEPLSHPERRRT